MTEHRAIDDAIDEREARQEAGPSAPAHELGGEVSSDRVIGSEGGDGQETRLLVAEDLAAKGEPERTQLMPGGGKPARTVDEGPDEGTGTLPMPKPGPRPDDPTKDMGRKGASAQGGSRHSGQEGQAEGSPDDLRGSSNPVPCASARNDGDNCARRIELDDEGAAGASADESQAAVQASPWRRLPWRTIAVVVVVVCVVAAVAAATYAAELWGGRTIPNVAGLASADAEARLRDCGFEVEEREQPADEGVGTVVSTEPEAGVRAASGSTVTVLVAAPRVVPDVEGSQLAEARAALDDAGITNLRLEYKNSDAEEGTVIGVSPAAGTVVTQDEEIVLQVAQAYRVPSVVGLVQDEATKAIAEAGLYSTIEWRESSGDSLVVLETSPASGEKVASGSTVTLTVVAPGPQGETYLAEYLSSTSQELAQYLPWKGWSFRYGSEIADAGAEGSSYAEEGWTKAGVGTLVLTPTPESSSHGSFLGEYLTSDVLANGAEVAGVRFEPALSGNDANPSVDSATVNAWASRCGLTGLKETLSGGDVAERVSGGASSGGGSASDSSGGGATSGSSAGGGGASGASAGRASVANSVNSAVSSLLSGTSTAESITGYGETGDYVWAVRVTGGSVVVMCANASLYDGVDLGGYDNSLAVYLAYSLGR